MSVHESPARRAAMVPPVPLVPPAGAAGAAALRRRELRGAFPATVEALQRRRADLVSEGSIADYVALHWLEWSGGSLRLTLTGTNICQQIRAGLE